MWKTIIDKCVQYPCYTYVFIRLQISGNKWNIIKKKCEESIPHYFQVVMSAMH